MSYSFLRYLLKERPDKASANRKGTLSSVLGFTMIEILVVLIIASVLAAIAAPGWLALTNRQRLNSAQGKLFTSMRNAQSQAKRDKVPTKVTFGDKWIAVHKALVPANQVQAQYFESNIEIKKVEKLTINSSGIVTSRADVIPKEIVFDPKGTVSPDQIEFQVMLTGSPQAGDRTTCVSIKTLLGAIATGDCK
jgi:prepilin-type N-terminal cleavage/methylation domain-containing protein